MDAILNLSRLHSAFGRALDALQPLLLLVMRCYVGWQFTKSGWLKLTSWETTRDLFRTEYHTPLLPPDVAAVAGTFGELVFPVLLYLGLFGRVGALAMFGVNAMAVIAYRHVLLAEGFEAAIGDHVLWGLMLLTLILFGPGRISVDHWLERQAAARCRPKSV